MIERFFSLHRFMAIVAKEFIQMRRDRLTFAMMVGIPLLQLILFGYAINSDPRHLPTAILPADNSPFSRAVVSAMEVSTYFRITRTIASRAEGKELLFEGEVQFILTIPEDFSRRLLRGEHPILLLEADATDPLATGGALGAFRELANRAIQRELMGPLSHLRQDTPPVTIRIHADYNPEQISQYNIVPGLVGVVLTLTLVIITSLALTRERERGTMENLLATPVKPLEVMLGKIVPYILVGYFQISLILIAAHLLFNVPFVGNIWLLFTLSLIFIAANLSVGVTFSTLAKNQLQAVQMSVFFFLPSLLLSGFMLPFRGMPQWAQYIGEILPLTHFLRIIRGILLKGNGIAESWPEVWPLAFFWLAVVSVGLLRYHKTLD